MAAKGRERKHTLEGGEKILGRKKEDEITEGLYSLNGAQNCCSYLQKIKKEEK